MDESGCTPNIKTTEDILRTSSFAPGDDIIYSASAYSPQDDRMTFSHDERISFQHVDTGTHVVSVEKAKQLTRSMDYSSYFNWMTKSVLVGGREFQFEKKRSVVPRESLRPSVVAAHRVSASLNKNVLAYITNGLLTISPGKCREIFISCSEMVLLDKLSDIPVGSLFSGQKSFVVLSVAVTTESSADVDAEPVWIELGRSELVSGKFNPDFKVIFSIPRDDDADHMKMWRLEIYNVIARNQYLSVPRFSVDEAKLEKSFLAGLAYFSGKDLVNAGLCEDDALPRNEFADIMRPIISAPYDKSLLRFGGAISFRIRNMELYCRNVPMLMTERSNVSAIRRTSTTMEDLESNENIGEVLRPSPPYIVQGYAMRIVPRAGHAEHTVYLREECIESPYSLSVPLAFLSALLTRRTDETAVRFYRNF